MTTKRHDLDVAVAAVAWVVLVALAETNPRGVPEGDPGAAACQPCREEPPSLLDLIGNYRLDQYVTNPVVAEWVDTCIDAEWSALDEPLPA